MIACGIRTNDHASLKVRVPTALPMHMRGKVREIVSLETEAEHRGKGYAKDLLARICISADLSDTWLMLVAEPGDDGTDKQRLLNLYSRAGFAPIQADPILMVRPSVHARVPA